MAEPVAPVPSSEADTLVIVEEAPPKKRRRFGWLIALVIVILLLVIAFFVGDAFARQFATAYVRERIVEVLQLPPESDVTVEIGDGSVLLQAISGGLDLVTVDVAELTFGDLTGSAFITAGNVPLDGAQPVEKLGIEVTITEANVQKLAGYLSELDLKSIELQDGVIRVSTEFSVLFFTLPVGADLLPSAEGGGIAFAPQTIIVGEQEISVADLLANPQFEALAGSLLASQTVCVAGFLPEALTVDDVDVVGKTLVVSINGDGTALSDPALATLGTCP